MPKMSRMLGTRITSRLTANSRHTAMQIWRSQWKGFPGNSSCRRARRIWQKHRSKGTWCCSGIRPSQCIKQHYDTEELDQKQQSNRNCFISCERCYHFISYQNDHIELSAPKPQTGWLNVPASCNLPKIHPKIHKFVSVVEFIQIVLQSSTSSFTPPLVTWQQNFKISDWMFLWDT